MNRDHILECIRKNLPEIKSQFGTESIALFGSYAREENAEESDIDILVKMRMNRQLKKHTLGTMNH